MTGGVRGERRGTWSLPTRGDTFRIEGEAGEALETAYIDDELLWGTPSLRGTSRAISVGIGSITCNGADLKGAGLPFSSTRLSYRDRSDDTFCRVENASRPATSSAAEVSYWTGSSSYASSIARGLMSLLVTYRSTSIPTDSRPDKIPDVPCLPWYFAAAFLLLRAIVVLADCALEQVESTLDWRVDGNSVAGFDV
jgi:hypothetical protein